VCCCIANNSACCCLAARACRCIAKVSAGRFDILFKKYPFPGEIHLGEVYFVFGETAIRTALTPRVKKTSTLRSTSTTVTVVTATPRKKSHTKTTLQKLLNRTKISTMSL
jgi:hypothetical protein